jgi:hypothetical protein
LRCQMGLDNGNRSWQRRNIFRMVACFWAAFNGVLSLPATRPRVSLPPGLPHT